MNDSFVRVWGILNSEGKCDELYSLQFNSCYLAWVSAGSPEKVSNFVQNWLTEERQRKKDVANSAKKGFES